MTNLTFRQSGKIEVITLDRAEALNALNQQMVQTLASHLGELEHNADLKAVLIKGAGDRAFCAGGDIKAARLGAIAVKEGRLKLEKIVQFFVEEYALNKQIFHFKIPTVSFMNGITMGGGVGIAGPCKYRVATEKTVWAMPEVTIGFFPDVGAAYYLSRAPGQVGKYLALTGGHLSSAADLIKCGFATHFINSGKEADLIEALGKQDIETALVKYAETAGETLLPYDRIDACFAPSSVEQILENLDADATPWALETAALIRTKSPLSLKVALRHVELATQESFDEVIARDLKFAAKFLAGDDLIEGVRAVVVDKDKSPKWNPSDLKSVGKHTIDEYFN